MDSTVANTEIVPDFPVRVSGGHTLRPWHVPVLKALQMSHTMANTIPGTRYDGTYSIFDGS